MLLTLLLALGGQAAVTTERNSTLDVNASALQIAHLPPAPPPPIFSMARDSSDSGIGSLRELSLTYRRELCVACAFLVAGLVHGTAGFGFGMTAMAITPIELPMMDAVPVVAIFTMLICMGLAIQLRGVFANPKVREALPFLVLGSVMGVPIGVWLLMTIDPDFLKIGLGCSMLIFVVERVLVDLQCIGAPHDAPHNEPPKRVEGAQWSAMVDVPGVEQWSTVVANGGAQSAQRRLIDTPAVTWCVGVVSGVMGGALNEAGPPVVILLTLKGWHKDDAKATLQLYFLLIAVQTVCTLIADRVVTPYHLYLDAIALPAGALGAALGVVVYNTLDQTIFSRVIVFALLVTGVLYISSSASNLLSSHMI